MVWVMLAALVIVVAIGVGRWIGERHVHWLFSRKSFDKR